MSSPTRHAEIAGGGLAGLTTATALAQRGWSVRLHERGRELREIGAGIFMWENALRVLEELAPADRNGSAVTILALNAITSMGARAKPAPMPAMSPMARRWRRRAASPG